MDDKNIYDFIEDINLKISNKSDNICISILDRIIENINHKINNKLLISGEFIIDDILPSNKSTSIYDLLIINISNMILFLNKNLFSMNDLYFIHNCYSNTINYYIPENIKIDINDSSIRESNILSSRYNEINELLNKLNNYVSMTEEDLTLHIYTMLKSNVYENINNNNYDKNNNLLMYYPKEIYSCDNKNSDCKCNIRHKFFVNDDIYCGYRTKYALDKLSQNIDKNQIDKKIKIKLFDIESNRPGFMEIRYNIY